MNLRRTFRGVTSLQSWIFLHSHQLLQYETKHMDTAGNGPIA